VPILLKIDRGRDAAVIETETGTGSCERLWPDWMSPLALTDDAFVCLRRRWGLVVVAQSFVESDPRAILAHKGAPRHLSRWNNGDSPINVLELFLDTDAQAIRLRDTEGQALRADHSHVAQQGGHAMRTFDFAPSTVQPSVSTSFSALDQLISVDGSVPSYPP
jgi:hypothetical protein